LDRLALMAKFELLRQENAARRERSRTAEAAGQPA